MKNLPVQNGVVLPGLYQGIPAEDYHSAPGISSSQLKYLSQKTPAHWQAKYILGEIEDKFSASMTLGTVFHGLTLEPESFGQQFRMALKPEDYPEALKGKEAIANRLKAINADIKDKADKLKISGTVAELAERLLSVEPEAVLWDRLIDQAAQDPRQEVVIADWDAAHRMRDRVMVHPKAKQLLVGGIAESSIFAVHPETGLPVKVRPDYLRPDDRIIVDLKSTRDASPFKWGKDAGLLGYHLQQAMYSHVPTLLPDGQHIPIDDFVFVLCENTPPYLCECVVLEKDTVAAGLHRYMESMQQLAQCIKADQWPGYSNGDIITLDAPMWAA